MKETVVISVDYESPPAYRVAQSIWSALSRGALDAGLDSISARWEGLQEQEQSLGCGGSAIRLFVIGQDRPETVERVGVPGTSTASRLYGVVIATPEHPSPLSGSLLYQGVEHLTASGIKVRAVLPALIPTAPKTEGEAYAFRLLEFLRRTRERR